MGPTIIARNYAETLFDLAMQQQNVALPSRVRSQCRYSGRHVGHSQNRNTSVRELQPLCIAFHHGDTKRRKQSQDAAGLRRARSVVVTSNHHDLRIRQRRHQTSELQECVQDRRIRWTDRVKYVTRDENEVGPQLDRLVDRPPESRRNVSFTLIDPGGGQSLILTISDVKVGEVNQTHRDQFPTSSMSDWTMRMRA